MATLNCKREGGCNCSRCQNRQPRSNDSLGALTPRDLWHWLTDHNVPRSETDEKPMRVLLDLKIAKNFKTR